MNRPSFIETIAADFDAMAPHYDQLRTARYYDEIILRNLPTHMNLAVDVGCGTGEFTMRLAERATRVIAIDVSGECLKRATARCAHHNIRFAQIPAERIRDIVDPHTCEAVVANRVLHHCESIPEVIANLLECLRVKGRLIVLDLEATGKHAGPWLEKIQHGLYQASVLGKALCSGQVKPAIAHLKTEATMYRTDVWRRHLAHELRYDWKQLRDAMRLAGVEPTTRRLNFRFILLSATKGVEDGLRRKRPAQKEAALLRGSRS